MTRFKTIVVIQPGAIGDVVLGTPVATTLRRSYPEARIIYLTHASLFPLLKLCPAIDDFIAWNKRAPGIPRYAAYTQQLNALRETKPSLVVDLTSSFRTRSLSWLSGGRHLIYKKQPRAARPIMHVTDNYLETLAPLELPQSALHFPTLSIPAELLANVKARVDTNERLVAIVPGVGKHRPNRAWPIEQWIGLSRNVVERFESRVVLVGGADDVVAGSEVAGALGERCFNLVGQLSLPETAALLKQCRVVVSADTGPSHIAVAVGTPVIGLTGPTWPQRSGPYGMDALGLNACHHCRCLSEKRCLLNDGTGAGVCMSQIEVSDVVARLEDVLSSARSGSLS